MPIPLAVFIFRLRQLAIIAVFGLAVSPSLAAVAFDAESYSQSTSFTHTPVGTPRGVLVLIAGGSGAFSLSGVTYGGQALTEVALSPLNGNGDVRGFFLGSSVPTGAQTVALTAASGTFLVGSYTVTAAADTEVQNTGTINTTAESPSATLALSGNTSFVAEGWWNNAGNTGGVDALVSSSWLESSEVDLGADTIGVYRYGVVGSTDVTFGVFSSISNSASILAVAVTESAGGGGGSPVPIIVQRHLR